MFQGLPISGVETNLFRMSARRANFLPLYIDNFTLLLYCNIHFFHCIALPVPYFPLFSNNLFQNGRMLHFLFNFNFIIFCFFIYSSIYFYFFASIFACSFVVFFYCLLFVTRTCVIGEHWNGIIQDHWSYLPIYLYIEDIEEDQTYSIYPIF